MSEKVNFELDTIVCGDCLDVMRDMPDGCVDLVVTSPPYDDLRSYNGASFEFEPTASELWRIIKVGGAIVWIVADQTKNGSETGTSFRQALGFMEIGFNLHDTMIYERQSSPLTHNRYEQRFEYMFILSKGKPMTWNPIYEDYSENTLRRRKNSYKQYRKRDVSGKKAYPTNEYSLNPKGVLKGNIWEYTVGYGASTKDKIAYQHPAIFPERLAEDHIISWSNLADLIFDPFIGSGTTAVAALKLGRHFYGCDISQDYVDLANARIEKTRLELAQLEMVL
jgi:site-specific DNA-methyltransferase (adenine-specific)